MLIRNYLFHRVSDEIDEFWPPITTRLFESIIRHLKKKYLIVNLEDVLDNPAKIENKNRKLASIHFDDGFKDNIEYAAPLLNKYQLPAAFYVTTDCIEKKEPTWTYVTDHLLNNTSRSQLDIPFPGLGADRLTKNFNGKQDRMKFADQLKIKMKTLSNTDRLQVYESLKKAFNDVEIPGDKMMNWDDIRQLSLQGFTVGSHSTSHIPLVRIENDNELWQELKGSGEAIRSQLGAFPKTISYPNGNCDDRVREYASKAGYKYGLIVGQRFYNTDTDPNMSIPRLELYNEPFFKVKIRMSGIIRIFRQGVYEQRQK